MLENIPYIGEILSLSVALIWAFAIILFKKSGETAHPIALNIFKNTIGLIFCLPTYFLMLKGSAFDMPFNDFFLLFISGVIGIGIADTLLFKSLNILGASTLAIVDCMYAPFVIILSILFLGETLSILQIIGTITIILAILLITQKAKNGKRPSNNIILGIVLGILSMLGMAIGVVLTKPLLLNYTTMEVVILRLAGGMFFLFITLPFIKQRTAIIKTLFQTKGLVYLLSGSFIGTYVAIVIWMAGLKYTQASIASALNQTSNVFLFILGAILLKEAVSRKKVIAILLAVGGIYLVTFG
ncbi:MAG: DMT family transporter [Pseudomonadota bacterium]